MTAITEAAKVAQKERYRKWYAANGAASRKRQAAYYAKHPEKLKAIRAKANAKYKAKHPERYRANALRWVWKSRGVYPARPKPDACECCGTPARSTLHLDHNHASGAFRGWLCGNCNRAVGLLKDSPQRCRQAATYLEKTLV